jgi:flavin-dependent dehydrogenase
MSTPPKTSRLLRHHDRGHEPLQLGDGSRVAVIGGGPSGSYFAYFLLNMASMTGLSLHVDVYEPKDFTKQGPAGCNHCGGIVSESLVQILAMEGINLPATVVQRGIGAYVMHMDVGEAQIQTPIEEMRIASVHRGGGPKGSKDTKWGSFDGFLQALTIEKGANIVQDRVTAIDFHQGHPRVKTRNGSPTSYDLLVVAAGVNTLLDKLIKDVKLAYKPPRATRTVIREYKLGAENIEKFLGNAMHVFLLDIPRLEFAAIIPKGDYVTICMLGEDIDQELFETFLEAPEVVGCMPPDWRLDQYACQCLPVMNVGAATQPYGDRLVFIGDCGVTRLYKDGIGGAYRTAKAAAATVIFHGIAAEDFEQYYWPACRRLNNDNAIGRVIFAVTRLIQQHRFARQAVLRMTVDEQNKQGKNRRMSMILWDMFTGSAPYRDIFLRTLHPVYLLRLGWYIVASLLPPTKSETLR